MRTPPELLVLTQRRTRNLSSVAPPVIVDVVVSLAIVFALHVEPWIAIQVPAAVATAVLLFGFWLFQGTDAFKVGKATRAVTIFTKK
ncbi:MAG: hypothetical protein Q6373_018135 [Candidatus Sigynarchaeota archaeon]